MDDVGGGIDENPVNAVSGIFVLAVEFHNGRWLKTCLGICNEVAFFVNNDGTVGAVPTCELSSCIGVGGIAIGGLDAIVTVIGLRNLPDVTLVLRSVIHETLSFIVAEQVSVGEAALAAGAIDGESTVQTHGYALNLGAGDSSRRVSHINQQCGRVGVADACTGEADLS